MAPILSTCPLCTHPAEDYQEHDIHSYACVNPACGPSEMSTLARDWLIAAVPAVRAHETANARAYLANRRIMMLSLAPRRPDGLAGDTFIYSDRPWPYPWPGQDSWQAANRGRTREAGTL